ncbi:MAG: hypothetical protein DHS20C18_56070 [Saprospiraceae bacterium]|nr:MAG: hypothetical protein DHS20C18_56070 [Saprospiraceae bacterium]
MLCILIGFLQYLEAKQPYSPQIVNPLSESWRWKHFPELEGKGIRYIAETADQKVWVSCNEGVLEYDGYDWKTHDARNGLNASPVEELLITDDGIIYATSSNGIFRYSGDEWEHYFVVPENLNFIFHNIRQLADNSIMACSDWGVVHFLNNNQIEIYTSPAKIEQLRDYFPEVNWINLPEAALASNGNFLYVSDLLESEDGTIWFALTIQLEIGVLLKFKRENVVADQMNQYEVVVSSEDLQLGEGQQLLLAADKRIWVINSTSNKGLGVFDGKKWKSIHLNKLFGGDEYMVDIVQSANGTIWISSMAKIFAYADGTWEMYRVPNYPIPANRVILQNSQKDQLWVAGYKSKVLLLDFSTEQWVTYTNLSFQCEVSPDEQWFLEVNNRIVHRKGESWVSYGKEDGLIDSPTSIKFTSKGQIWVAGSHQGVAATAVLKNGSWERHLHSKLSWGIDYRSFIEARDGTLWFGGSVDGEKKDGFLSGILELPNPTADELDWKHHVFEENGLTQANVYGIGQSKDGKIWIGGSMLLFYDGNNWQSLPDEKLQQYVNVVCGTDDLLLVGSRYYGVFIFDGEKWENYNNASGLSGNTIISIDAVSDSCIFVATENDICRFDGISWTQNIFPEKLNMDFEGGSIFHTNENTLWVNHVPRSWNRRVYQNNEEKAEKWEFFTTRYQLNRAPPETNLTFFLETVSPEGNSLISWTGKDFFAYTPSEQLTYSYRLDKGEWSVFTKENQHTFTSMPSGMHTLEVRARDLDFNVDPTPAQIEFEVLPPIWKQGWFILFVLTFLLIFGIYEYRVISKKRKLEILNVSLQDANDKLKERGRKIEIQNQEILAQQEQILAQAKTLELNNKNLEERNVEIRQQRDKLEEMVVQVENLSKSRLAFFTNISHELRTPLTLIIGPGLQLQKEGESLSPTERNRLYDIIQRNAARLLKLINQLLEMRRIEHNALVVNLSEIRLPDYISEMMELFKDLAIKRDIHLDFTDKSEYHSVALDSDKVEKIMANLLSNAFKYTQVGGSILVDLNTVSADKKKLNPFYEKYFEIIVEDTGIGINQEKIDVIFEKYYTSESDITDAADSGIGLSYIRDLIYLMQGQIRVESQLGRGSKFMVYLPFVPVKESSVNGAVASEKPKFKVARQETSLLLNTYAEQDNGENSRNGVENPAHPRVLLVEDNPDMLHFLESILQNQYQVITAENGKEGLKVAQNQIFDLIISDVMMPEMDGLLFCEKLKNNFATSHIPVILLTAKMLEENKISGYLKGADDYITKPFNPDLLLVRIDNLLQQRKQLREVFNKDFMLTPQSEKITSPDEELLQKLVQIMNENVAEADFNVDKMCKMVHLSHMHFIRKVKQLTGKKPIDLLKSFRMKKAKELLAQQKLTVAEVAYKVGFDLPNSFSRAFKKEFNITPTEYVNNN